MNRKQAGEDFYFIQKLVPAGGYFTLNSTIIYPSPRPSFRVPFGTGASINKLSVADKASLPTYNLLAFKELRSFFLLIDNYLKYKHEFEQFYLSLPDGVKSFLDEKELFGKLEEIRNNTSGFESGRKRFFGWFNMFRVVKYLNHVHSGIFEKKHVLAAAAELLEENGILWKSDDPKELLLRYRSLEQTSTESNTGYRSPI
jgi:hypothetical protein